MPYSIIENLYLENKVGNIGILLKKIRLDKNITQTQVADSTELTQQMISKIEKGSGNPTLKSLVKYCDCIGIDLYSLIKEAYYKKGN